MALPGMKHESWGSMLKDYKMKATNCAWGPQPIKHVTRYEKSREERAFDPVLQRHLDSGKEKQFTETQSAATLYRLNKARDTQLRYTQTYDIITHVPRVKEPKGKPPAKARADTRQTHNIITNINFDKHHFAKPGERPEVKPMTDRKPPGMTVKGRDYSIISNKYLLQHEAKDAIDAEVSRQKAAELYWQTHNFNPLTCSYFDESKEKEFSSTRNERQRAHGKTFNDRFPSTIRHSEGICYDVITMDVKDEKMMAKHMAKESMVMNTKIANEVEQRVRLRGDERNRVQEHRSLARVSEKRFREATRHGYDIVTNERFNGVDAKKVHPHFGSTSTSAWDQLRAQAASSAPASDSRGAGYGLAASPSAAAASASRRSASRPPSSAAHSVIQPSPGAQVEVITRPQSVPVSRHGRREGSAGGGVRTGGFGWGEAGGSGRRSAGAASQRSRPEVPPLAISKPPSSQAPTRAPSAALAGIRSQLASRAASSGSGLPPAKGASGAVRTGGFH